MKLVHQFKPVANFKSHVESLGFVGYRITKDSPVLEAKCPCDCGGNGYVYESAGQVVVACAKCYAVYEIRSRRKNFIAPTIAVEKIKTLIEQRSELVQQLLFMATTARYYWENGTYTASSISLDGLDGEVANIANSIFSNHTTTSQLTDHLLNH